MNDATWERVHSELTRLARSKGEYDVDEARWLLVGQRIKVHEPFGCASLLEYMERVFGYGPRMAKDRLRVAEALVRLPAVREALSIGALSWSAVREISRVAVAETEAEWLSAAVGKTVREVEEMVSGRKPGDKPSDDGEPVTRAVLRLEISSEALAAFREARRQIELEVGHSLDDDAAVRMLAHYALRGPDDPGRAAYQVALTVCKECRRGTRDGSGQEFAVEAHHVEAACCDAQEIDLAHVGADGPATQNVPPRVRRLVERRDHGRCQIPGCRSGKFLELHHIVWRSRKGGHETTNLILVCSAHHTLIHRGILRLEGTAPDHIVVRRADGRRPGEPLAMELGGGADRADAVDGLRRIGVPATDARRAVGAALEAGAVGIEDILRQALRHLGRTTYASRVSIAMPA